jgi:hypothetical protein
MSCIEIIQPGVEVIEQPQVIELRGGTPGRSAYELAVGNGFVGSLEDWLGTLGNGNILMRFSDDGSALHFYTLEGIYKGSQYLMDMAQPDLELS